MSALNLSYTDRIAHDNYPTPAWVTRALLDEIGDRLPSGTWYEPCVGEGAIVRATEEWRTNRSGAPAIVWAQGDLRLGQDFLAYPRVECDVLITNPPFSLADPIARKAVAEAPIVILLLSLIWPKAGRRAEWLRMHPPSCYPVPQPIPFVVCYKCANEVCGWEGSKLPNDPTLHACPHCAGKLRRSSGDMVGYGWYVWGLDPEPRYRVLRHTSLAERRAE